MQLTSGVEWRSFARAALRVNNRGSEIPNPVSAPTRRKSRRLMPSQSLFQEEKRWSMVGTPAEGGKSAGGRIRSSIVILPALKRPRKKNRGHPIARASRQKD